MRVFHSESQQQRGFSAPAGETTPIKSFAFVVIKPIDHPEGPAGWVYRCRLLYEVLPSALRIKMQHLVFKQDPVPVQHSLRLLYLLPLGSPPPPDRNEDLKRRRGRVAFVLAYSNADTLFSLLSRNSIAPLRLCRLTHRQNSPKAWEVFYERFLEDMGESSLAVELAR